MQFHLKHNNCRKRFLRGHIRERQPGARELQAVRLSPFAFRIRPPTTRAGNVRVHPCLSEDGAVSCGTLGEADSWMRFNRHRYRQQ